GGNPSCESIQLRLAIGQEGLDVDFCLNDFAGSTGEMSDLTIDIASVGEGFNPDFGQLISLVTNSLSGTVSDHLLPLIGLGSDDTVPFVPQLDILNLLMDSNGPDSIIDGIKSWSLAILTNPIDFESWLRHLVALLSGSDPESGFLPGDGTEGTPWGWTIPLGSDGTISFEIWMRDLSDGSTRLEFGLGGSYDKDVGLDGHNIELNLDARIASVPLVGGGPFKFLDDISLGFLITKSGNDLFQWSPGAFPDARVAALNSLSGSIGSVAGGVTLGSDFQLTPYLRMHEVVLGGSTPREIDLLSGGLLGDLVSLIDRPMRNAISDLLASDPYLQRIGAILGLVSPRNDGTYFTRSNGWESDGSDLRIGGDMPNLSLSDFFSDPASTIGRYHSTLLEMNELPGATGDMVGIKPWAFILEAFIDIVQSVISQAQGGSPIPIRTDGATDVLISSVGGTDAYKVTLTPSDVSPPLILEVDYTSSSNLFEILPYMGVGDIPIGNWMLMDLALSLDLVSLNLPNPSVADSQASNLTWVPGARLDATLHGLESSGGSGNVPIPLIDIAS
ncbi:MAG: hypothetical protein VX514_07875, partial [Candidatus Thermoplasmatota archaeon]|nr:hypothetical protein [Candidatus Thermoplasmatota archaeon]